MYCKQCGAKIEEDTYFCLHCGKSIQLVPDFNPMDDLVDYNVLQKEKQKKPEVKKEEGLPGRRSDKLEQQIKKRKRQRMWNRIAWFLLLLSALAVGMYFVISYSYANSYAYQIKKADECMVKEDYRAALGYLNKAASLKPSSLEPYYKKSEIYMAMEEEDTAIAQLKEALAKDEGELETYMRLIDLYEVLGKTTSIKNLLDNSSASVRTAFAAYVAEPPEFNVEGGIFNQEQTIELSAENGTVYYTLDYTTPDSNSIPYLGAINIGEGKTVITAVTINAKGIASDEVTMVYEVELSLPDPPEIEPKSGTYFEETFIEIKAPRGSTIYYTENGDTPDEYCSKYSEPVKMKEGEYIFSAIVVDKNGKKSGVTIREYKLTFGEEEQSSELTSEQQQVVEELEELF